MRKILLLVLLSWSLMLSGQGLTGTSKVVGAIGGTINASIYGGAVYSIPLELPDGINGMKPDIGLVYNSQSGNGVLGYGWGLSGISAISHIGSTLFHDGKMSTADFSGDDRFCLDGQRLIMVGSSGNDEEYKTEQDEFSKVVFHKENGLHSTCDVWTENGNHIKYGYTSDSRLMSNDGDSIIKWMVSSITDGSGNSISYMYETSGQNGDIYIKQINYTENENTGNSAEFSVTFHYSSNRFDSYHYYIAGSRIMSDRLLDGISISKGGVTIEGYSFTYDGNTNRMYNLLTRIDFSKGQYEMNPTVIEWNIDNSDVQNNSLETHEINPNVLNDFTFVGDVNGDGYSDLITVPYRPAYGYTDSVGIKIFHNQMNGVFNTIPDTTLYAPTSLEWLHVVDLNGDGYDDIVIQTIEEVVNGNNSSFHTSFKVYESQSGNRFNNVFNSTVNAQTLVRIGDFLGEGRNSIIILPLDNLGYYLNTGTIHGIPNIIHYQNGYMMNSFTSSMFYEGVVVTDDFTGDGKAEMVIFETTYRFTFRFSVVNGQYVFTTTTDYWGMNAEASYFSGDFNGDGKADVLFDYPGLNDKYVILSTGSGFTDWISVTNSSINSIVFPGMQLYSYSLYNVSSSNPYGVSCTDLDGDGKTDMIFYNGNNHPIFYRNFKVTDWTALTGTFNIEYHADYSNIKFMNQYFTIGNFLGRDNVSCMAVDPNDTPTPSDDMIKIYNLPSTAERFSVNAITNGFGMRTDIEYSYLMPGNDDFYIFNNRALYNGVKPVPLPMLAMKSYTEHIGSNSYKTAMKYTNLLIHKDGRGILGYDNIEKTTFANNTPIKIEKAAFETATMGVNAIALPSSDSIFICGGGATTLIESNSYTFDAVRCSRQVTANGTRLVSRPAMVMKKTKNYNPDQMGGLLSVDITEYTYTYQNNLYSNAYCCTATDNGVNKLDCASASACEFRNNQQISFKTDDYSNWVINRKSEMTTVAEVTDKPSVTRKTKYEYSSVNPFLVSSLTCIPSASNTDPLAVRTDYVFDSYGNITSETRSAPYGIYNEPSVTTQYTYTGNRLVASKTVDPSGLAYSETYVYDAYDRVTSKTGSDNLVTTYSYNNTFNTIVTTVSPDNVTTIESLEWVPNNGSAPAGALYMKQSHSTGRAKTTIYYDAAGNAIRTTKHNYNLDNVIVDACYNDRQLLTQQSEPYLEDDTPQFTTYQYDMFGRNISAVFPDGHTINRTFNGYNTITTTSSGTSSRTEEKLVNAMGWTVRTEDAAGNSVVFEYCSDGKLAATTTSGGAVRVEMEYDNAGNRISIDDPDYGESLSVYDAYGRLVEQETPKGDVFEYSYDLLGRLTQKQDIAENTVTQYVYNESSRKGTLASVTHNGQSLAYSYDICNRLTGITETRDTTVYTTALFYDQASRVCGKTYPTGYTVFYEFYPDGTKKNVKDANGNILWHTHEINARGQLLRADLGNGTITNNIYDDLTGRLLCSTTSDSIQRFAYTYDGFGNMTSRSDSIGGVKTETFQYDNLDRLLNSKVGTVRSRLAYDSYGRMTHMQKDGNNVFYNPTFSSTKPHAMTSATYPDVSRFKSQYVDYTSFDKVKRLAQGSKIVTFTYGYDNQRTQMTITDTLTGNAIVKTYVGGCEIVDKTLMLKRYTYLTGPYGVFAVVSELGDRQTIYYIHKDHLGSWTTITDTVGRVVERRSFDAWGNMRDPATWSGAASNAPMFDRGFTGHEHLYNFGLINMNGRMYDPEFATFLSPDNYVQDPTSQQSFNRYAYCMYNPLKYVDPTGERYYGWSGGSTYYAEQEYRALMRQRYDQYLELMSLTRERIEIFANSLWSQGYSTQGSLNNQHCNGSGNGGGAMGGNNPKTKYAFFNKHQLNAIVDSDHGKCVLSGLGSMMTCWGNMGWGETTKKWVMKERDYCENHLDKDPSCHGYEAYNLIDFITWDNNGEYNTYKACDVGMDEIYDYMNDGWVVAAMCRLYDGSSHYANVTSCTIYDNGAIDISFLNNPLPGNTIMEPYTSNSIYEFNSSYSSAKEIRFIAIKLIHKIHKP